MLWIALRIGAILFFFHAHRLSSQCISDTSFYDVHHYQQEIKVELTEKSISGRVIMRATCIRKSNYAPISLDLDSVFHIEQILFRGQKLPFQRIQRKILIQMPNLEPNDTFNDTFSLAIDYDGKPRIAKNPPWEGGFVWKKTVEGKDWLGVACQGEGASLWWPCKDLAQDEPDSVTQIFYVPKGYKAVGNGQSFIINEKIMEATPKGYNAFQWKTTLPINLYNVTLNVAPYITWKKEFKSKVGIPFQMRFHLLPEDYYKGREHFKQIPKMWTHLEALLGPYPMAKDGYQVVETPYWGMEHQSCTAYGHDFTNNNFGFDFILLHETVHEYFGNALTASCPQDLWIHEGLTTYIEALYVERTLGWKGMISYLEMQKKKIKNEQPIYQNKSWQEQDTALYYDTDLYYKGSWMYHTLRNVVANDSLWFQTIRKLPTYFGWKTIDRKILERYFSEQLKFDVSPIFHQYLDFKQVPVLVIEQHTLPDGRIEINYHLKDAQAGLSLPFLIQTPNRNYRLLANDQSQHLILDKGSTFLVEGSLAYIIIP